MKIILLRSSGTSHAVRLTRKVTAIGVVVGALVVGALGTALVQQLTREVVDADTVAQWQQRLVEQQSQVESLRARSRAETQAVGRQLAQMQARLTRMEALGARVTEVADLDEGEFAFAQPVAQGGPSQAEAALPWPELHTGLDELARDLQARENELEVLESLLRNRDYRHEVSVTGRPVKWGWLSSPYGYRVDPFSGKKAWHAGVDFAGKEGSEVVAVASGVVTHAGKRYGYGKMVEITHSDGYVTRYGHHKNVTVAVGQLVKKGEVIGHMGSSGRSTGPHVHFEVLKNGRQVNPERYVARR